MASHSANNKLRFFTLLVIYRWISILLPILLLLIPNEVPTGRKRLVISIFLAVILNIILTLFSRGLNQRLIQWPWILGVDLVFVAALLSLTGGWQSPFYLYALNPLLIAGFFFLVRGAVFGTTTFIPLYFLAIFIDIT